MNILRAYAPKMNDIKKMNIRKPTIMLIILMLSMLPGLGMSDNVLAAQQGGACANLEGQEKTNCEKNLNPGKNPTQVQRDKGTDDNARGNVFDTVDSLIDNSAGRAIQWLARILAVCLVIFAIFSLVGKVSKGMGGGRAFSQLIWPLVTAALLFDLRLVGWFIASLVWIVQAVISGIGDLVDGGASDGGASDGD